MFRPFTEIKDELADQRRTFDAEALRQLHYSDLHRAATGDAGAQACDYDLVEAERNARLAPWLAEVSLNTLQARRDELKAAGVFEDLALRLQAQMLVAMPAWDQLSPRAVAYFLIRCLRSHADDPQARIKRLRLALDMIEPHDQQEGGLLVLLRFACDEFLAALEDEDGEGRALDIKFVRLRLRGFEFLTRTMSSWEKAVCASLTVQGYSCTAGCFTTIRED